MQAVVRMLMWVEFAVAVALGLGAFASVIYGTAVTSRESAGGGSLLFLSAAILVLWGMAFFLGSLGLRRRTPSGWLLQILPIAASAWIVGAIVTKLHGGP